MGSLLVITGDFNEITHSINGVLLVLITGKWDITIVQIQRPWHNLQMS